MSNYSREESLVLAAAVPVLAVILVWVLDLGGGAAEVALWVLVSLAYYAAIGGALARYEKP